MSYEGFKQAVKSICAKAGGGIFPRFSKEEDGRFVAQYDDVTIIGRPGSYGLTVRWGSGHQAMVPKEATA